jgi:hypothetical protein
MSVDVGVIVLQHNIKVLDRLCRQVSDQSISRELSLLLRIFGVFPLGRDYIRHAQALEIDVNIASFDLRDQSGILRLLLRMSPATYQQQGQYVQ